MISCGLLGEKLGHSYSPVIHGFLADYEYKLYQVEKDKLSHFLKDEKWDGLNVTIPYKKTVLPYCDELSPIAKKIGSVNTLVKRKDGTIFGDNTDVFGFENLVLKNNIDVSGKKTLILGSGGASVSVREVLEKLGAETVIISRTGESNYQNLYLHKDAKVIVNTTPVGMYPHNGESPLDLTAFPQCEAVLDIIYNPARTALMLQAEELGIKTDNGLNMLVAQAKRSSEIFTDRKIPDSEIDRVEKILSDSMKNVVIIGMPGCGKTTISRLLSEKTGRGVIDTDEEIEKTAEMSIPEIFEKFGQAGFRRRETEAIRDAGKKSGFIISTGGGCVTIPENYPLLHQNSIIVWLQRDTAKLARDGRPLSINADLEKMYEERKSLYSRFADIVIDNNRQPSAAAEEIWEKIK